MLDHDPALAARMHCDRHVINGAVHAARVLSSAWHWLANGAYQPLEQAQPTPWLQLHVDPASGGTPDGQPPQVRRAAAPGESPFSWWLLHGQRIYQPVLADEDRADSDWASQTGGNYDWLWRLGMALTDEYQYRFGKRHPTAPVLWALEPVPAPLADTLGQWNEAPLPPMSEELKVVVKGYYDTVPSVRAYYTALAPEQAAWTRRPVPGWLK